MKEMIVRDGFAVINGDKTTYTMPSGELEIVADDGRPLFCLRVFGSILEVSGGYTCKHEGVMLDDKIVVVPVASNRVDIVRNELKADQ